MRYSILSNLAIGRELVSVDVSLGSAAESYHRPDEDLENQERITGVTFFLFCYLTLVNDRLHLLFEAPVQECTCIEEQLLTCLKR